MWQLLRACTSPQLELGTNFVHIPDIGQTQAELYRQRPLDKLDHFHTRGLGPTFKSSTFKWRRS